MFAPLDEDGVKRLIKVRPVADAGGLDGRERIEDGAGPDRNSGLPQGAREIEDVLSKRPRSVSARRFSARIVEHGQAAPAAGRIRRRGVKPARLHSGQPIARSACRIVAALASSTELSPKAFALALTQPWLPNVAIARAVWKQ